MTRVLTDGAGMRVFLTGILIGLTGLGLFGLVHAVAIVPIWDRLLPGAPFAITAGVAVGWAYHEVRRSAASAGGAVTGLRFGAFVWLACLPATALSNAMRLYEAPLPLPAWVDGASFGLAVLSGATLLWHLTHTQRGVVAGAIALGVLLAAGGGPVPVANGRRATGLLAGFLVVEVLGGGLLGMLYARLVAEPSRRQVVVSSRGSVSDDAA